MSRVSTSLPRTATSGRSMRPPTTSELRTSWWTPDRGSSAGKSCSLPAGAIERVDLDNRKVVVRFTKDQIKNSPEYDADTEDYRSDAYRERVGTYYDPYL
jgi:hypothetical protein